MSGAIEKIDKFLIVLIVVFILMAILMVYTFQTLFSAYFTAFEIDPKALSGEIKVNKQRLDEAHSWAFNKESTRLNIIQ